MIFLCVRLSLTDIIAKYIFFVNCRRPASVPVISVNHTLGRFYLLFLTADSKIKENRPRRRSYEKGKSGLA
jgi:hypothetical protein